MIDKSKALTVFQISEDEYDELLKEFLEQIEGRFSIIQAAVDSGDTATVGKEIHALKGVAGNMRLDDCYNVAVAIESATKAVDEASQRFWLSQLRRHVDEIRVSITPPQ